MCLDPFCGSLESSFLLPHLLPKNLLLHATLLRPLFMGLGSFIIRLNFETVRIIIELSFVLFLLIFLLASTVIFFFFLTFSHFLEQWSISPFISVNDRFLYFCIPLPFPMTFFFCLLLFLLLFFQVIPYIHTHTLLQLPTRAFSYKATWLWRHANNLMNNQTTKEITMHQN